ncbi:hypothetical protein PMIN01_12328 [Paraphaeosphaeria minitans]|uniref:Uncharacterized protein n=1 Tax=Paraphaeosphaeria minitans TaxID=565426 RepID=A0A9P6G5X2_9PLEO|nr:hypothetical protein PMIN01_12328 [Paraphaeosphaeria minitans]
MSRSLSKKEHAQHLTQQHQGQQQVARDVETTEHKSSANASAGLNLNLFGALSGAMSSAKRKETHTAPNGSSHTVEDTHDKGTSPSITPFSDICFIAAAAAGHAAGQGSAFAKGSAQDGAKHEKRREVAQTQEQGKLVSGQRQRVDHLGIEK